mmetsp:Transcript_11809/g.41039  ORF Transcript_11809/g.41039 Transcript_11809/m.41039 type:complete len:223 (+) Transcript_11809:537-1205(+)
MHPTLHTSMAVVYSVQLSSSSGARYHLVTTYSVMYSFSLLVLASPKSHIFRSQLAFSRRLLGLRSRCRTFALCTYFRPRRSWYTKYWQWSSDRGWLLLMIWCRSVSMSSYTTYTSLNDSCGACGFMMSLIWITFSWRRWRRSLISRRVRLASMAFSNALPIFFIAILSPLSVLRAEHTTPYAPLPMGLIGVYFASTSKRFPHTMKCDTGVSDPPALALGVTT